EVDGPGRVVLGVEEQRAAAAGDDPAGLERVAEDRTLNGKRGPRADIQFHLHRATAPDGTAAFGAVAQYVVRQPPRFRRRQDAFVRGGGGAGVVGGRRAGAAVGGRRIVGPQDAHAKYGQDQRTQADALCTHVVLAFSGPARSQGRTDSERSSDGPFYSSDAG